MGEGHLRQKHGQTTYNIGNRKDIVGYLYVNGGVNDEKRWGNDEMLTSPILRIDTELVLLVDSITFLCSAP